MFGVWCVAGSRRAGHWDEVIEEAAGELEGVEGQLHTASRQLLDLRSATAQLSADAQQASAAKQQARPRMPILTLSYCTFIMRCLGFGATFRRNFEFKFLVACCRQSQVPLVLQNACHVLWLEYGLFNIILCKVPVMHSGLWQKALPHATRRAGWEGDRGGKRAFEGACWQLRSSRWRRPFIDKSNVVQAEREAKEAREQLTEALAEASAARHDAARHRAAADAAVRERSGTDTERARLAAEAERLKGEVQGLARQMEEASSSCQAQVGREEAYITSFLNRK